MKFLCKYFDIHTPIKETIQMVHSPGRDWSYDEATCKRCGSKIYKGFDIWRKLRLQNLLIINQFAYHDGKYWWKGMDLNELKEKAKAFDELTISMSEDLNLTPEDFIQRKEKAKKWDKLTESFSEYPDEVVSLRNKLEDIGKLMTDACETVYEKGECESCAGDPGYEDCLTRKIMEVLNRE